MNSTTAWILANGYTDESLEGGGAVKGKNCTIGNITKVDGVSTVTFKWTLDDGTVKTGDMKVADGLSIKSLDIVDGKLVVTLSDGSKLSPVEMPQAEVKVSQETGNALTKKDDGLFVAKGAVEISKKEGNIIKTETDGLYAKADEVKKSTKTDNILEIETDGSLYVPKADAQIQADFNQTDNTKADFIKNKPTVDQTYSATSENAQSGKAVASAISTELGKLTYLSKEIATKTEIDGYVADPTKAKFNVIYLLKDDSAKGSDKYFEYQRIGNETSSTFEMTGDTSTDLSDYVKKNAIVKAFNTTLSDENIASEKLVKDSLDEKVDIQQKVADKGKALVVGEDGKLILGKVATNDIGSIEANILGWNVPKECAIRNTVNQGEFAQYVNRTELSTLNFAYDTTNSWFYVKDLSLNAKPFPNADVFNGYCVEYENKSRNSLAGGEEGIAINTTSTIIIKDSRYSDVTSFKSAVKGLYLYYELATEQIIDIDGNELIGKGGSDGLEIVDKTQAEYDALSDEEKNDPTKLYNITDSEEVDVSKFATKEALAEQTKDIKTETSNNIQKDTDKFKTFDAIKKALGESFWFNSADMEYRVGETISDMDILNDRVHGVSFVVKAEFGAGTYIVGSLFVPNESGYWGIDGSYALIPCYDPRGEVPFYVQVSPPKYDPSDNDWYAETYSKHVPEGSNLYVEVFYYRNQYKRY